ncbi:MAG: PolC-type DNA polymerase III [Lachnospiraceae bacterium]|nr:PolC-type DNA polymerase III [Lachnospiraceae bacterium]
MTSFNDAFQIELDSTDRRILSGASVLKLLVAGDRSSLDIYVKADEKIPSATVTAAENAIREQIFEGKNVRVSIIDTSGVSTQETSQENRQQTKDNTKPKKVYGQSGYREARNEYSVRRIKKSDNPDVIYGYDITGTPLSVKSLEEGMGEVIIQGKVFSPETITTRNGKYILTFNITDRTDSITCKLFCDENAIKDLEKNLSEGQNVMLSGFVTSPNQYNPELTISNIKNIKKISADGTKRSDTHEGQKRTELILHSNITEMDSIGDISEFIKLADKWGWDSIAITDTDSVQAFPTAAHAVPKGSKLKLLFGINGHLVDDTPDAVYRPKGQSLDDEYVVFDLETTGFSQEKCRIIEIGAVKVKNGKIVDRFSQFVDPGFPIPQHITELTSIKDQDVQGQGGYEVWIPRFLEFCGDSVAVGHNALFDVGFVDHYARKLGTRFDPTVVDTLGLAHMLLKDLYRNKLDNVAKELGISMGFHHRAVDDAEATAGIFLKCAEILKGKGITDLDEVLKNDVIDIPTIKKMHGNSFDVLIKNDLGRTNLYRLVSASFVDYFYLHARMPKSMVQALRDGLLLGSGNEEGELYDAVFRDLSDERVEEIASFYDYLEILPPCNLKYLYHDDKSSIDTMDDIIRVNNRILSVGRKLGIPVVASGDVRFPEKEDAVFRKIIRYFEAASKGRGASFDEDRYTAPLYLKTTDEMLEEFSYLDRETAEEIVIRNPHMLSDMCERISPVRPDKCPPVIENSDQDLKDMCYAKAKRMYGDPIPEVVLSRLDKELNSIISNGYSVMYIIAQRLIKDSMDHGYLVGSRGSVGSSLVATMADISEVNPLPPHYRCENCHYSDFTSETVMKYRDYSGCDMPDAVCPVCGKPLIKDGFSIPFETFLGFKGDKEPDIDLNFAGDYQPKAHAYTGVLFGEGNTFKAGTIGRVQDKTAFGYVERYNEDHNVFGMRKAEKARLALGCTDVKRTTGQHPGGIIVLPHGEEIHTFTPIQHPANDMESPVTTHFDYHSIDHNLLKLDILGKDDPSMVRMLQDLTGVDPMTMPIGVPEVLELFKSTKSLGISPEDIGGTPLGTLGIPEFGTDFAIGMLLDAKPQYVSDLVRIAGLAHGTDVWLGNAQTLIEQGKCTIQTAICTRDDMMLYLIEMGLDPAMSFKSMEAVRKGKVAKGACDTWEDWKTEMRAHNVPEWYIESCNKIKYMFPKAHAAAYVVMGLRIAYFKVYYPKEYYAAYFTVKGSGFDYEKMNVSLPILRQTIKELKEYVGSNRNATANDKLALRDIRIVEEMMARGVEFAPIDIFKAKATQFTLTEDGRVMPSLNSISGLGDNAAAAIEADAVNGPYLSVEEFIQRTKVSKTNAEQLKALGLLGDLTDTNQMSIFDMMAD